MIEIQTSINLKLGYRSCRKVLVVMILEESSLSTLWEWPSKLRNRLKLEELLKVRLVNPPGSAYQNLRWLKGLLRRKWRRKSSMSSTKKLTKVHTFTMERKWAKLQRIMSPLSHSCHRCLKRLRSDSKTKK